MPSGGEDEDEDDEDEATADARTSSMASTISALLSGGAHEVEPSGTAAAAAAVAAVLPGPPTGAP